MRRWGRGEDFQTYSAIRIDFKVRVRSLPGFISANVFPPNDRAQTQDCHGLVHFESEADRDHAITEVSDTDLFGYKPVYAAKARLPRVFFLCSLHHIPLTLQTRPGTAEPHRTLPGSQTSPDDTIAYQYRPS